MIKPVKFCDKAFKGGKLNPLSIPKLVQFHVIFDNDMLYSETIFFCHTHHPIITATQFFEADTSFYSCWNEHIGWAPQSLKDRSRISFQNVTLIFIQPWIKLKKK